MQNKQQILSNNVSDINTDSSFCNQNSTNAVESLLVYNNETSEESAESVSPSPLMDTAMQDISTASASPFETVEYKDPEEERRKLMQIPEVQAQIVYENYIKNTNRILSGKEKRTLRRECERNAKKGKYKYLFDEEMQKKREARAKAKFDALNSGIK